MGDMADMYDDCYDEMEDSEGVTCKRCGKGGLVWDQSEAGRWVLMTIGGRRHKCATASVISRKAKS